MNLWRNLFLTTLFLTVFVGAQSSDDGVFYEKNRVKGFFAFKGDWRILHEQAANNINDILFRNPLGANVLVEAATGEAVEEFTYVADRKQNDYGKFGKNLIGLNVELGAQYHQFLTWFDIHFMPTQVSLKPKSLSSSYRDVEWFRYGFDWMFAWMLLQEDSPINLIPSVGLGLSLQNFKFAANYEYPQDADEELLARTGGTLQTRFYSRFGSALDTQIELRFNFGFVGLGAYAGMRFVRYEELVFETNDETRFVLNSDYADANGDERFVGAKIIFTLDSPWEKKQKEIKNLN